MIALIHVRALSAYYKSSKLVLAIRYLVLCCVVIFTSEMMHGWMVIMMVMDHLLRFYFMRTTKFKKKSLR